MRNARQFHPQAGKFAFPAIWTISADEGGVPAMSILQELLKNSGVEVLRRPDGVLQMKADDTLAEEEARFTVTQTAQWLS